MFVNPGNERNDRDDLEETPKEKKSNISLRNQALQTTIIKEKSRRVDLIEAVFQTPGGVVEYEGDTAIDGVPGTAVVVTAGGASLQVVPPDGAEGSTVAVAVVNADGQATERAAYFHYARPPVVTNLVRADGSPARGL